MTIVERSIVVLFLSQLLTLGVRAASPIEIVRSTPEYLAEHATHFKEEIVRIADSPIWLLKNINGQMSNAVLIEAASELIVFDTGASKEHGAAILKAIRGISDKPIRTLIYSHHHGDHTTGAGAIVEPADVARGEVKVIARSNFMREYIDEDFMTGPIQTLRSIYQFGGALPEADLESYVIGLSGGELPSGDGAFIEPNVGIAERRSLDIDGVRIELIPTGGESITHMVAWLPQYCVMLSGDEFYPAMANLHSPRGTKFRDARNWINAIDEIRSHSPCHIVPSHGPVVSGIQNIASLLTRYRDSIQYQHDQAVRFINKGLNAQELAQQLSELPGYLYEAPYTTEMYGKLRHNVPNIFHGYISWFSGDAVDLGPTPAAERDHRLVQLMGGRERVLSEARSALDAGDAQFAAELASMVLKSEPDNLPARQIKAAAFKTLGYQQINSIWRSWYLTAAEELNGNLDIGSAWRGLMENVRGAGNLSGLPTARVLEILRYNIAAERFDGDTIVLAWDISDRSQMYISELRSGVLIVRSGTRSEDVDATLSLTRATLNELIAKPQFAKSAIEKGLISVSGDRDTVRRFFDCIDEFDYNISLSGG